MTTTTNTKTINLSEAMSNSFIRGFTSTTCIGAGIALGAYGIYKIVNSTGVGSVIGGLGLVAYGGITTMVGLKGNALALDDSIEEAIGSSEFHKVTDEIMSAHNTIMDGIRRGFISHTDDVTLEDFEDAKDTVDQIVGDAESFTKKAEELDRQLDEMLEGEPEGDLDTIPAPESDPE